MVLPCSLYYCPGLPCRSTCLNGVAAKWYYPAPYIIALDCLVEVHVWTVLLLNGIALLLIVSSPELKSRILRLVNGRPSEVRSHIVEPVHLENLYLQPSPVWLRQGRVQVQIDNLELWGGIAFHDAGIFSRIVRGDSAPWCKHLPQN